LNNLVKSTVNVGWYLLQIGRKTTEKISENNG